MILNGYILETHVLTTFEAHAAPTTTFKHSFRKHPWPFTKRELPYTKLCFEIEYGRVINPVQSYKSGHCVNFLLWIALRFLCPDPSPIPYFIPRHLLSIMLKKTPPNLSPFFQSCPKIFLTCTVRMIYRKYLSEHIIPLPTTPQWLSIILRIKVSLSSRKYKDLQNCSSTCSPSSSLIFFTSELTTPLYLCIESSSLRHNVNRFHASLLC